MGRTYGVPHSFIAMIVLAAVMWVVLHRSVFGRHLFAVGKNEEAARRCIFAPALTPESARIG